MNLRIHPFLILVQFILFFKSSKGKKASTARNWIHSILQPATTTFAFFTVFILYLWLQGSQMVFRMFTSWCWVCKTYILLLQETLLLRAHPHNTIPHEKISLFYFEKSFLVGNTWWKDVFCQICLVFVSLLQFPFRCSSILFIVVYNVFVMYVWLVDIKKQCC